jgi:hypothetical protein
MTAPRLLRRGLELFAIISVLGFGGVLFYGNNLEHFAAAMLNLNWPWLLLGLAAASMDWVGGGLRLYVLARHVYPATTLRGAILSAGVNAWATMLTPSQAGGGPLGIYAFKRSGTPIPEGMIATFMGWVATLLFFGVAGPTAVALGAGRSLEAHGVLGQGLTLNDLFRLSLVGFVLVGVVSLSLILFPGLAHAAARRVIAWFERRGSERVAKRLAALNDGVDRAHEAMLAYFRGWGWVALAAAVVLTGLAYANKLLAGFLVLRALNIEAHFVDVLLLQTLITFLLYFAPTPGGSGLAEILSVAVMSVYVPRELAPSYILLWRVFTSYLTVGVGSAIFWRWLKSAEAPKDEDLVPDIVLPLRQ